MNTSLRRLCHTNNLEGWIYVISTSNIFNIYLIVWVFKLVKLNVAFNATFGLKKMNKTVTNTVPSSSLSCNTFASFFHLFYFLNFFIVCFAFFSSFNAFLKNEWSMVCLELPLFMYILTVLIKSVTCFWIYWSSSFRKVIMKI